MTADDRWFRIHMYGKKVCHSTWAVKMQDWLMIALRLFVSNTDMILIVINNSVRYSGTLGV